MGILEKNVDGSVLIENNEVRKRWKCYKVTAQINYAHACHITTSMLTSLLLVINCPPSMHIQVGRAAVC